MLFQELGKMKRSWIMTSIMAMAIGIIMIICPERYVGLLISALGYALLVLATVMGMDFLASKKVLANYISLTGALIVAILGFFVLVHRKDVLNLLGLLFGLLLVIEGIMDMFNTFLHTRRSGKKGWGIMMVLSALLILFGLIILTNPWWTDPRSLMEAIGGMMLFSAVVSIVRVVWSWPFKNV
jgi:uncharacterized membrane protein HdeD (DUF308 family)